MKLNIFQRLRIKKKNPSKITKQQLHAELKEMSEIIRDCDKNGTTYPKYIVERYKQKMLEYKNHK